LQNFLENSKHSEKKDKENLEVPEVTNYTLEHVDQARKTFKDSAETDDLNEAQNNDDHLQNVHLNYGVRVNLYICLMINFHVVRKVKDYIVSVPCEDE